MNTEVLGHNARQIIKKPGYAIVGIVVAALSVFTLVSYWIAPNSAFTPLVSIAIPVVVIAYVAIVFTAATRLK